MSIEYFQISFHDKSDVQQFIKEPLPFQDSDLIEGSIIQSTLLTKRIDQTVPHVYEIKIRLPEGCYRKYQGGDTIGILPKNDEEEVREILQHLNLLDKIDQIVEIRGAKIPKHIPPNCSTLKELFMNNLGIRGAPKKLFLQALARHTDDPNEICRLNDICKRGNSADYFKFVNSNEAKTLLGILKSFPKCQPTLVTLIEFLPALKPRPYSIASAFIKEQHPIEIVVAFSVQLGFKNGPCSTYLEKCCQDQILKKCIPKIQFYFRKTNNFRLPLIDIKEKTQPIIMIATGVGLAPFMGFLDECARAESKCGIYLYYGCRYENQDFIYKNMLQDYQKDKVLTKLFTAFSRGGPEKVYIQERIKETWEKIYYLITKEEALIYVCGDANTMMVDVKRTIVELLMSSNGLSKEEAANFVKSMEKNKTYLEDKWI